jgi:hypothetical protein
MGEMSQERKGGYRLPPLPCKVVEVIGRVQQSDAATAFWKDFYEKYPDLLPHESVVDAVTVKLKASGYKGSREEVMETIAKAVRQELARYQQPPPIVGVGQSDRAATSSQNTPRERVELDRQEEYREEHESTKVFLCFWGFGLVWFLIDQAPTAALSWFLGFPIARWIYLKIKKRYNG